MRKLLLLALTGLLVTNLYAQKIPFQGKLLEDGIPFTGTKDYTFSIDVDGNIWTETQNGVSIQDGLYSVVLGTVTPLPSNLFVGVDSRVLNIDVGGNALAPIDIYAPLEDRSYNFSQGDTPIPGPSPAQPVGFYYTIDKDLVSGSQAFRGLQIDVTGVGRKYATRSNVTSAAGDDSQKVGFLGSSTGEGTGDHTGIYGQAFGLGQFNDGLRGVAGGAGNGNPDSFNAGVSGQSFGNSNGNTGGFFEAIGETGEFNTGVRGESVKSGAGLGTGNNVGVFGLASGGDVNYGGSFETLDENAGVNTAVYAKTVPGSNGGGGHAIYGETDVTNSQSTFVSSIFGVIDGGPRGSGDFRGMQGQATVPGGATNMGVRAYAGGEGTNYGIRATAVGGTANYAGWFDGDVHLSDGWLRFSNTSEPNAYNTSISSTAFSTGGPDGEISAWIGNNWFDGGAEGQNRGMILLWGDVATRDLLNGQDIRRVSLTVADDGYGKDVGNLKLHAPIEGFNELVELTSLTPDGSEYKGTLTLRGSDGSEFSVSSDGISGQMESVELDRASLISNWGNFGQGALILRDAEGADRGYFSVNDYEDNGTVYVGNFEVNNNRNGSGARIDGNGIISVQQASNNFNNSVEMFDAGDAGFININDASNQNAISLNGDSGSGYYNGEVVANVINVRAQNGGDRASLQSSWGNNNQGALDLRDGNDNTQVIMSVDDDGAGTYWGNLNFTSSDGASFGINAYGLTGQLNDLNVGNNVTISGGGFHGMNIRNSSNNSYNVIQAFEENDYGIIDLFNASGSPSISLQGGNGSLNLGTDPFLNGMIFNNNEPTIQMFSAGAQRVSISADNSFIDLFNPDNQTNVNLDGSNGGISMGASNNRGVQFGSDAGPGAGDESFLPFFFMFGDDGGFAPVDFRIGDAGAGDYGRMILNGPNGNNIFLTGSDGSAGFTGNVTVLSLTETSDMRLKTNIKGLKGSLSNVLSLRGVSYNWKDSNKSQDKQIGLIAQEVEEVYPEFVHTDEEGMKSVRYSQMVSVLIESIKELNAKIEALETENSELKAEVVKYESLQSQVDQLQVMMQNLLQTEQNSNEFQVTGQDQ